MLESANIIAIQKPIEKKRGHSFVQNLGAHFEHSGVNGDSSVFVFEDGKPLGPSRTPLALIERDGRGSFCHWGHVLHFSASDNSDPNTNGRIYTAMLSPDLYFKERYIYSLCQVQQVMRDLGLAPDYFKGKHILEIGPGPDAGFALLMAGLGATIIGVEKHWEGWKNNWHSPFIDAICRYAGTDLPGFDPTPLRSCQKINYFDPIYIDFRKIGMEDFLSKEENHFDLTFSTAVLEHVCDPKTVVRNLFDLTKPGGFGLHTIDFRDHRDFSTPLEFLMLDDNNFEELSQTHGPYWFGNRTRFSSYFELWRETGFKNIRSHVNEYIQESYYNDFVPRLHISSLRFKNTSDEDLRILGATFSMGR